MLYQQPIGDNMLKSRYIFAPFSRGLNEQSDLFQLNGPSYDSRGGSQGLNFELRKADNFVFSSVNKIKNKPFDEELLSSKFPKATSIESDGDNLFRIDENSFYQFFSEGYFDLKGKSVPNVIEKYFVSSEVESSSYAYCNNKHYCVTETDQRLKITILDEKFNKISSVNIRGFPRARPYVFCYGTTVFISCFNEQTIYVYSETGHLIFARAFSEKIKEVKGFDRLLFVSIENQGLGYINFLTGGPFEVLENGSFPDYYDMHYNPENDLIYIAIIMNSEELIKGLTLNRSSLEITEDTELATGIRNEIDLSSENKDIIMFGPDSFIMRFSQGALIKKGNIYKKVLNFKPYYVVSDDKFVLWSTNGFFLVDSGGNVIGRYNGSSIPLNKDIFQRGFSFTNNKIIPSIEAHRIQAEDSQITTDDRLTLAEVKDGSGSGVDIVRVKNTSVISGSVLSVYDGEIITNTNFNQRPVLKGLTDQSTNEAHPIFRFVAIYKWSDGQGNIYRSEPSNFLNLRYDIESIDKKLVDFSVTNLNLTNKKNVKIEIYRTEPNESVSFYKAGTFYNNTESQFDTFQVDIIPSVTGEELLYITGGGTANIQPEGARFLKIYNGRLYAARATDDNKKINVSKPISDFEFVGVEFSGLSSVHLPEEITSHEVMDDKYIIFTPNNIYFYRENLREPEPITGATNIGCVDLGATVLDKDGIYFKSKKGVYLLDRGLSLSFIGYHAEQSLSKKIVRCVNSKSTNEIYFLNEDGDIIVYNTFFKNFTLRNSKIARSIVANDDRFYILDSQSKIYDQNASQSNSDENFLIETGWIQLTQIMNRQRIREIYLLGDINSVESLRLTISYDFKDGDIFVRELSNEEINKSKVFAGQDIFRGNEVFGLTDDLSVYRFFPSREECVSLKLKIDITSKQGFSLSGLGFCYAYQGGMSKRRVIKGD